MNQNKKIYKTEREGQIEFFDNYGIPWEENDGVLVENCDGVYNGVLFEFKLNINDLNKTLFQAVKYLSQMRLKGESVPAVIILVDLNARKAYVYHSEDYRDDIQKVYVGPASKNNAGFSAKPPVDTYDYSDDYESGLLRTKLKKEKTTTEKYMAIDIDENCILGWAERFYREVPKANKGDFLGDEKGTAIKIVGEIREPKHFAGLIKPYTGKTNKAFNLQMDCLNDRLSKKDLGAFYTHPVYANLAVRELVLPAANAAIKAGKKDYVILDRCAGTGNLESALIGLKDDNGDELISHCIVSTYEYWEYKVLNENIGDKVRHIIPSSEANVEYFGGKVLNADAMSEEYINNKTVKQYLDDEDCAVILFENPPYRDEVSDNSENRGAKVNQSFVFKELFDELKNLRNSSIATARDLSNQFIYSGAKHYLRQDTDSYIVFSPIKYWKTIGLIDLRFESGFLFNRKEFHATESAISCILWSNKPGNSESVTLHKYSISDNEIKDNGSCTHIKTYDSFSEKYFDCNIREDDEECGVFCEADGTETSGRKCTGKSYYNKEIIAYMRTTAMAINAQQRYLTRQKIFNAAGFYLRRNTYMVKLPMFVAKLLPQDSWDEKDVYFTTSDGGDAYTKDDDFLKSCLLYTCLSNQNKCLSFLGSDGRMYQNELCLDNSRYEKAKEEVTQDGKEADSKADAEAEMLELLPVAYQDMMTYDKLDDDEKELLELWKKILGEAKQTEKYNPELNYGVYQITKELNTFTEEKKGKSKKKVYDYPQLNGDLNTLRTKLKEYYVSHIKEKMFKYQLIK